jgi:PBSX family phage portal protein
MADEKKPEGQQAQVYRLVKSAAGAATIRKLTAGGFIDDSTGAPGNAVASNAAAPEDEYQMYYIGGANDCGVLCPPYNLRRLDRLAQENNTLSPCIEAMVTNIDGTGYDFSSKDEDAEDNEDDDKIAQLRDFFAEPLPGTNFISLRKKLRRDLEATGNAYLEVLRNAQDQIVFLKHVDSKMMRLVKLDDPVAVDVTVKRNGADTKITMMKRERRFVQLLNGVTLVYFKEFGASRDVSKSTGLWAEKGKRLPAKERGTEILHFTCLPDAHTDYGVPRWISQLPSVLGSRKAEEFNLDFFDNGGIPPVLITLQGGTLQSETRKALENKMTGSAEKTNRVQILEVEPAGGSLDHPTQARVTVERFGGDRTNDSMFEGYDDKCEGRVRRAFRLAPIFLGASDDYSFASAYVSYTVTEAQVFKPERDEFDEIINSKLLPEMGYADYRLESKPLVIEDVNLKIEGLQIALGTNRVDVEDVIYELNEATGLDLKVTAEPPPAVPNGLESTHTVDNDGNIVPIKPVPVEVPPQNPNGPKTTTNPAPGKSTPSKAPAKKFDKQPAGIYALAKDTLIALRKRDFESLSKHMTLIKSLDPKGMAKFKQATAELQFVNADYDAEGLGDLATATIALMHHAHCDHPH